MKLMQKGYNEIQALEVELRILEQTSAPPSRPRKHTFLCSHFQYLPIYNSVPHAFSVAIVNES